jgi:hypothetical protein
MLKAVMCSDIPAGSSKVSTKKKRKKIKAGEIKEKIVD